MELPGIDYACLSRIVTDPLVVERMVALNGCLTHEAAFGVQYHLVSEEHHVTPIIDGEVESVELDWEKERPEGWVSLPLLHYHTHALDTLLMPTGWKGDLAGVHEIRAYDRNENGIDFRAVHGITRYQEPDAPWDILFYQESRSRLLPQTEMKARTRQLLEESFYVEAEQADVVNVMRKSKVYHCELLTLHRREDGSRFFPDEELEKLRTFAFDVKIINEKRFRNNYLSRIGKTS